MTTLNAKLQKKLNALLKSSSDKIYVAVYSNRIVGYIHVNDYELFYSPSMKNIMGIAVSGEYRRMGIGKALLSKAEEWARETGSAGIRLVSGESRIGAHKFYQHCGYTLNKTQMNFSKIF